MTAETTQWSLSHVWEALRKYWALVIGLAVLGGAAGYLLSSTVEPQFESRASLYFALNAGDSGADLLVAPSGRDELAGVPVCPGPPEDDAAPPARRRGSASGRAAGARARACRSRFAVK